MDIPKMPHFKIYKMNIHTVIIKTKENRLHCYCSIYFIIFYCCFDVFNQNHWANIIVFNSYHKQ